MDAEKNSFLDNLQSFDLGEKGGGTQVIIDYRPIEPGQFYVMTLGNGPKLEVNPDTDTNSDTKSNEKENNKIKIRFFKLTLRENKKYLIEEFVSLESIRNLARLFRNS